MGVRLEPDTVRKIALELMIECNPWEIENDDAIMHLKYLMYDTGVMDMANNIIQAIEKLQNA